MAPSRRYLIVLLALLLSVTAVADERTKIIIDTDIGDDIDDAYALALALSSPELDILGVTAAWGPPTCVRAGEPHALVWVVTGIILQSSPLFYALCAVL